MCRAIAFCRARESHQFEAAAVSRDPMRAFAECAAAIGQGTVPLAPAAIDNDRATQIALTPAIPGPDPRCGKRSSAIGFIKPPGSTPRPRR